jgi:DNA-binding MarR family transcriptional regulator
LQFLVKPDGSATRADADPISIDRPTGAGQLGTSTGNTRDNFMDLARETVDLLFQVVRGFYFDDDRRGLRDREWMALRFLSRANRFSRTPSALASFMGTTRASASQIVAALEQNACVVRERSQTDKRSVTLCVTPLGEKLLAQHDPIDTVRRAVAALAPDDGNKLRGWLQEIVARVDKPDDQTETGKCRDCIFLVRGNAGACAGKSRPRPELLCRFHRTPITADELDLLCVSFERNRDQLTVVADVA